jgi:hypothetical protein
MSSRGSSYYYGSYGIVRGYGPLCQSLREADRTVQDDGRRQRLKGGSTDRNAVVVTPEDGLCWWADDEDDAIDDMLPVRTAAGVQAQYAQEVIRAYELLWSAPKELPGLG